MPPADSEWSLQPLIILIVGLLVIMGGRALIGLSNELKIYSYPLIVEVLHGKSSILKYMVEALIILASISYLSVHMIFLIMTLDSSCSFLPTFLLVLVCTLLTWIRQLWKLSFNYFTGNLITALAIIVTVYSSHAYRSSLKSESLIYTIGVSLSSFEGISLLLPLHQHALHKDKLAFTSAMCVQTCCMVVVSFYSPMI